MNELKEYQNALISELLQKEYQRILIHGRQIGKTTMANDYLKYQYGFNNTILTKQFRKNKKIRKTIILHSHSSEFQLLVYNRNDKISHQKHSLKSILKYLKKNLTPEELLETEQEIFKIV